MSTKHIYVISDLHLGGAPEVNGISFQLCPPKSRCRLARFIRYITTAHRDGSTQLVINGDFIDFLAEERISSPSTPTIGDPEKYQTDAFTTSQDEAVTKLERVIKQTDEGAMDGERVFDALRTFLAQGCRLTLLIGNHDIELSFPAVRRKLFSELGAGPAQIEFLYDGEALTFDGVLIEHGNRYDGWNAISHGSLRAYRSAASRGETHVTFQPPPGSQLVANIMNPLKRRYRFIDLVKPENEALIPILAALEPDCLTSINDIVELLPQKIKAQTKAGKVPQNESFVASTAERSVSTNKNVLADSSLRNLEEDALDDSVYQRTKTLLDQSFKQWAPKKGRVSESESLVASWSVHWLTSARSLWHLAQQFGSSELNARLQRLRQALLLHKETIATTFDLVTEDPFYSLAARRLAGDNGIIVFGHTHIPKCIAFNNGYYLNSGTWCPTVRLPSEFYDSAISDGEILPLLKDFITDLATNDTDRWCTLQTTFVKITLDRDGASAMLCEFSTDNEIVNLASTHG